MAPGFGAGTLGEPVDCLTQGRCLQCAGQIRQLGSHITAAGGLGGAITPPARRDRPRARRRSRPGRVARPRHRRLANDVEVLAPQQLRGLDMVGIGDRLMLGPDPPVISDQAAVARTPGPGPGRRDLDAATDRSRVHRVVVAVQAHVVITRQPGRSRHPMPAHRRQRQHRGPIGLDAIGRARTPAPAAAGVGHRQPVAAAGR